MHQVVLSPSVESQDECGCVDVWDVLALIADVRLQQQVDPSSAAICRRHKVTFPRTRTSIDHMIVSSCRPTFEAELVANGSLPPMLKHHEHHHQRCG